MGTIEENLATNLKRLREQAGLTLIQLAKATGVDKGTINKWENQRQGFRKNNLKTVAVALGCSVNDLISDPPKATTDQSPAESDTFRRAVTALATLNESQMRSVLLMIERLAQGPAATGSLVGDELKKKSK